MRPHLLDQRLINLFSHDHAEFLREIFNREHDGLRIVIPEVARGYEEIYRRFVMGKLIYKPDPKSDAGRIELPIRALANPLEGTFDLSGCGDTWKYLSISTGYRKSKKAENATKAEIFITPRFLVDRELQSTALHLQPTMVDWDETVAPVGIFWTWGGFGLQSFDYLVTESMSSLGTNNLYEKWQKGKADPHYATHGGRDVWWLKKEHPPLTFRFHFE